jgi:1,4-dihydroxy-2-naphthoyl-CoA hydrolase
MLDAMDVDTLNRRGAGRLPELIGIVITGVEKGALSAELTVRPELLAPNGYLHAGTVITLADTLCGYGCIAHLPAGASGFTTIELKANFLGTARDGVVECEARPQHAGRTTQVWDATVRHRETGKTIAVFRCTQMILWPKPA